MDTEVISTQAKHRWVVLAASLFAFVAYAFAFQTAPPLFNSIQAEFSMSSSAEVALVMSVVLIPGIFLSVPAGLLVGKYGVRKVGTLSLLGIVGGSLVSAMSNSFFSLLIGRLILGLGGTFVVTVTPFVIAQWFTRESLGKAMGIFGINMPLGTVIALPASSTLLIAYGWRFPFYVNLIVAAFATLVFSAVIRDGPLKRQKTEVSIRKAVLSVEIWKVGLAWLFFNAAALSFTSWGGDLFKRYRGFETVQANLLASLLMLSSIFCVPIYGYLSDRTAKRKPFAVMGFILMASAFILAAFTYDVPLIASILFIGISAAMIPPVFSALPAQVLGPSLAGIGFGITSTCLNIGAAIAQPSIGFVKDITQSFAPCLLTMAALAAIGAVVAYALKSR